MTHPNIIASLAFNNAWHGRDTLSMDFAIGCTDTELSEATDILRAWLDDAPDWQTLEYQRAEQAWPMMVELLHQVHVEAA